jgi:outer membrane protein insertion porin family
VTLTACSPTRYIADDQALVKKVALKGIDKDLIEEANLYVQKSLRPNSKINLALYNLVNTKHGKYRTDRIRNVGEAPHILDSTLVDISRTQLQGFLNKKGFFKAQVKSDVKVNKKKATVTFTATQGPAFKVKNIEYLVDDPAVAALYEAKRPQFTRIQPGMRYDADSLTYEQEQFYRMMQKNGYYDYKRQYMHVDADSTLYGSEVNLKIFVYNPENKPAHQLYTLDTTFITIKTSDAKTDVEPDTAILESQYYFKDYSHRFRPVALKRYIFFKRNDLYNIENSELTFNRLYELNEFKSLKIDYIKASDSTNRLNPYIEAVPLKRMSNRIEGEYTFNQGRNGFNIGNVYTNRNLFGGSEQLELRFRYGVVSDKKAKGVLNSDLQAGVSFTLPRLLVPFSIAQSGKNGLAHSTISSSLQLFNQKNAFNNRLFINSLTYNWVETIYKLHSFTPLNIEYRKGVLDPEFKAELQKNGFELYIRTNERQYFNMGSQYSFTYNNILLNRYDNFFFFKGNADVGGNTLYLLSRIIDFPVNSNDERTINRLAFLQYAKTDFDFRWYRTLGGERQLIARFNPGIAAPYLNSRNRSLPFEKNFYAGGSGGVRAWQARTLGPGNYNRSILSPDLRTNLRNLDQLGEIKLESNLEYRFKLVNSFIGSKVKGATFTDFGNVWRLSKEKSIDTPGGEFKFNKFISQLAIGAGVGLRFDVEYFIFRFDVGVKIKDPQFKDDPWVIRHIFDKAFKDNYRVTNGPDTYTFIQPQFGIGMPF